MAQRFFVFSSLLFASVFFLVPFQHSRHSDFTRSIPGSRMFILPPVNAYYFLKYLSSAQPTHNAYPDAAEQDSAWRWSCGAAAYREIVDADIVEAAVRKP